MQKSELPPTFRSIPILVYHGIDEYKGTGLKELYVTPANFEKQMRFLKYCGFTLLTFERWCDVYRVDKPIFITFDDGYKNNLNALAVFQKVKDERFQPVGTIFVMSEFFGISPDHEYLSESDLKEMSESQLFSVQSHGATHSDLRKVTDYEYELKEPIEKIESITGKPVLALAYPYGYYNARVVEETKKYYQFAVTTEPGPFIEKERPNECLLLPRIYVYYSTTLEQFARLVSSNS